MATKVLLVANDIAPTQAFQRLIQSLEEKDIEVISLILDRNRVLLPQLDDVRRMIVEADIVLSGLSSPAANAVAELTVLRFAIELGRPFGLYADTFGAWRRPWFADMLEKASFIFVVNETEREIASTETRATVVATGNPLWEEYFAPASFFEGLAAISGAEHELIVLAPGTKTASLNLKLWCDCIDGVAPFGSEAIRPHVVLARHPGDTTPEAVYESLISLGTHDGVRVSMAPVAADRIVPAASVVVHLGVSSVAVHAACRRIPVIDLTQSHLLQELLRRNTGNSSTPLARAGGAWICGTAIGIMEKIGLIYEHRQGYHFDTFSTLRKAQEKVYPALTPGMATERMATFLKMQ